MNINIFKPKILIFSINGKINMYNNIYLNKFYKNIEKYIGYRNLNKVFIIINSKYNDIEVINSLINRINYYKNIHNIEFNGFIEDFCLGSNYLLASKMDKLYCNKNSIIGNFNFIYNKYILNEVFENLKININIKRSNDNLINISNQILNKDLDNNNKLSNHLDFINNEFKNDILKNRNLNNIDFKEKYKGSEAEKIGLVDGFDNIESYLKNNQFRKYKIIHHKLWVFDYISSLFKNK